MSGLPLNVKKIQNFLALIFQIINFLLLTPPPQEIPVYVPSSKSQASRSLNVVEFPLKF